MLSAKKARAVLNQVAEALEQAVDRPTGEPKDATIVLHTATQLLLNAHEEHSDIPSETVISAIERLADDLDVMDDFLYTHLQLARNIAHKRHVRI